MTRMILPALAAAAMLGACQPSADAPANTVAGEADAANEAAEANAVVGNAAENITARVLAMSDRERNVVFIRALLDAGLKCDGVESSERLPDQDGQPLWRANCVGTGGSHMIAITPDGTANIVSRTDR